MSKKEILPQEYLNNMKTLLGKDFESFLNCYDEAPSRGLRFNTKKVRPETAEKLISKWRLEPVPWCKEGYYYPEGLRPGLSPYHDAGVFYIQEPSAMLTVSMADIAANDLVLDLCAAPGGKSTQAAAKAGTVISNEPILKRARILSSNIERMGFDNVIVTSAYPEDLARVFENFFDKIIVDAPCSGEGMMRKDDTAAAEWSADNVRACVRRQADILGCAAGMLKNGGSIAYSTCTFERAENEGQTEVFLKAHPDFTLKKMRRIWPYKERGEGHFCAVLARSELPGGGARPSLKNARDIDGIVRILKKNGIHVLRAGVEKGEKLKDKRGREYYVPTHAEAMNKRYELDKGGRINIISEELCLRYLRGETIDLSGLKPGEADIGSGSGNVTVYYDAYPVGNGKITGGVLKNHYPKGLRRFN